MLGLIAVMAFVVVAMGAFAIGSLLDERNARARLMRERLTSVRKAAERQPSEELALLRDEMLSESRSCRNFSPKATSMCAQEISCCFAGLPE
ncbi:MAG: hypothetical protein DMG75_15355 [Acidobacteria bacterium]|nr:MAG: hypothetical protein DMG75_15355 [Acidobacteriota bacterium]